jgi:UPF0176 protein
VIHVATFYRFVALADPEQTRTWIEASCRSLNLLGTVLLAREGINATLAGSRAALAQLVDDLAVDAAFQALNSTWTTCKHAPFRRLKVKVRAELVALRRDGLATRSDPAPRLSAAEWNSLLDDSHTLVLDVRNRYESSVGAFPRAVHPDTKSFHEFPRFAHALPDRDRPIAMYCTGGIRCEKASAYLKQLGFAHVFQLDGGILRYLETAGENNRFEGECFLFDHRVAIDRSLAAGTFKTCHACRHPLSVADRASPLYREGESCAHCDETLTAAQRAGFAERRRQALLAERRARREVTTR